MGIKPKNTAREVRIHFSEVKKRVDEAIFMRLSSIGERLVNYARSIPAETGYTDRTGNLRSSTGYVVVVNGNIAKTNFEGTTGASKGEQFAAEIAGNHKDGHALIVVAGMDYALAVESRGKDVLTTTEYMAQDIIVPELRKLKNAIERMKL